MRVHVTQADIDAADVDRRESVRFLFSVGCPVARALSRTLGREVLVAGTDYCFAKAGDYVNLPIEVYQFTSAWDSRQPVQPFDFEV